MDNLHERATRLADTHSPYMLAKILLFEQKERVELAAHVERLRRALDNILHEVGSHQHDDLSDDEKTALEALSDTPITSLTKRDLLKQAEALDNLSAKYRPYGLHQEYTAFDIASHLEATAITLRQQANQMENNDE